MNAELFRKAEELFHQATAMEQGARNEFLADLARRDSELAETVARLVRFAGPGTPVIGTPSRAANAGRLNDGAAQSVAHGPGAASFETPPSSGRSWLLTPLGLDSAFGAETMVGTDIGPYKLTQLLGEGGFGSVYLAQQSSPVRRSVAIKMIRAGLDSRRLVARFEAERQAMATLDHPNIAKIFDAGQTDHALGSRLYVVMEYIDGQSITEYCQTHALSINARLELFMSICQAVQHAHQKGIIHRDLKPSNILVREVNGTPAVAIIDFGIAKVVYSDQEDADRALMTQHMELLGTPQYMSPEHADPEGRGVDTRADIYSLGAVLYELLTGAPPLDSTTLTSVSYARMLEIIRTHTAERPSNRVGQWPADGDAAPSHRGKHERNALRRRLKGDLDWITLKALDPDRDRRYANASALENDIRRHLNHEPVDAGPPSTIYRFGKFVRRHRFGVAAAAVIALAVIGGVVGTLNGIIRARDAADQAKQVNTFMFEVLGSVDPDSGQGADVRFVEVLHTASDTVYERFSNRPELEVEIRKMLGRVYLKLRLWPQAVSEHKRLWDLLVYLYGADDPRSLYAQNFYATSLMGANKAHEAQAILDDEIPRVERTLDPDNPLSLQAHMTLGSNLMNLRDHKRAEPVIRETYERGMRVLDDRAKTDLLSQYTVLVEENLRNAVSDWYEPTREELERLSSEFLQLSLKVYGLDSLSTARARLMLAEALIGRGELQGAGELAQLALDQARHRLGECHNLVKAAQELLANILLRKDEAAKAADLMLSTVPCVREKNDPLILLSVMFECFPYLDRGERWAEGEALAKEAQAILTGFGGGHGNVGFYADLQVARFVSLQGRMDEAEGLFQGLLGREQEVETEIPARARLHMMYGAHLGQQGKFATAEVELNKAQQVLGDMFAGTDETTRDDLVLEFIKLYKACGKPEKVLEFEQRRAAIFKHVPMSN